MRTPPSLLSLTIKAAVPHISHFQDLSSLPDHILLDLFLETLKAGKLTEKVLNLFISTGKDDVISLIKALNIKCVITPVLPTRCTDRSLFRSLR